LTSDSRFADIWIAEEASRELADLLGVNEAYLSAIEASQSAME